METVLCAAVGTARHQYVLETCTVYGDCTVCSCRHSKISACVRSMYCVCGRSWTVLKNDKAVPNIYTAVGSNNVLRYLHASPHALSVYTTQCGTYYSRGTPLQSCTVPSCTNTTHSKSSAAFPQNWAEAKSPKIWMLSNTQKIWDKMSCYKHQQNQGCPASPPHPVRVPTCYIWNGYQGYSSGGTTLSTAWTMLIVGWRTNSVTNWKKSSEGNNSWQKKKSCWKGTEITGVLEQEWDWIAGSVSTGMRLNCW